MLVLVVIVIVMMTAAALVLIVVIVVVMMVMLMLKFFKLGLERVAAHRLYDLLAAQLCPGGRDQACVCVQTLEKLGRSHDFLGGSGVGAAHNDEVRVCDLVVEELTEVAHIHTALARVHDGDLRADLRTFHVFNCRRDVGELADAGRLDNNAVGRVLVNNLFECLCEVAHESAADAPGVHLGDLYARVLEKASVDGYFTELVFNQNKLFALVALRNELADEGGFAGAEEAGENVYSGHGNTSM